MTKMQMRKLINLCEGIDNKPISEDREMQAVLVKHNKDILELREAVIHNKNLFVEALEEIGKRLEELENSTTDFNDPGRIH